MARDELPQDLLAELEPEERQDREGLLAWLVERGLGVDRLREAASEGRLTLLPAELVLNRGCRYSLEDAAGRSGLDRDFVVRLWRATGIPVPDGDESMLDDDDLEAMQTVRQVLDAGLSEDAYIDISRVLGRGSAATAESAIEVSIEQFLEPGDSESALAMRLQEVAELLTPLLPVLLALPMRMHLRNAIGHHALERREKGVAGLAGTRCMSVGFADLVGFTALSERATLVESGDVAQQLEEIAASVAEPPVRLVKLIGDGAMLVSDEPMSLVRAMLRLNQAVSDTAGVPELRCGLARGEVAPRAGEVYGPVVNLASRLAGVAEPGQVVASAELADELSEQVQTRRRPSAEIEGIGIIQPVELVALRGQHGA